MNKIMIKFLGAAGTVTGSKHLTTAFGKNILIDCGLFQGLKELRLLNWEPLSIPASEIDIVLLTHGHLDHTGYLPKLVKEGFKGRILGTAPTLQITEIILSDSAKIQEEDTARANRMRYSKHHPALPLYGLDDVDDALKLFQPVPLAEWYHISQNIRCRFRYNGHIIGATFIELEIDGKLLVFSGDVGRINDPLLHDPERPERADILFIEATYGNRLHASEPPLDALAEIIKRCTDKRGTVIIPSFSVERTQLLMYLFWQLKKEGKLGSVPIYMDSPMGRSVLEVFNQNRDWHKLSSRDYTDMCSEVTCVGSMNDTLKLANDKHPKIIIAGSGMAAGGRVLTYFTKYLGDHNATIMLAGFQAEGTRGRALLEGAREIRLYGKYFTVRASIENLEGLSGHADQNGLSDWVSNLPYQPERIFIVHAENDGAVGLQSKLKEEYGWQSEIPALNDQTEVPLDL